MGAHRLVFGAVGFASLIGIAVACGDGGSAGGVEAPDGAPPTTGSTCPCAVGGITISCGGAQCVQGKGYRCAVDGPHEDDALCDAGASTTGGCTPSRSCASELARCGSVDDGCGSSLACGTCPAGQGCTAALGGGAGSDAWRCFTKAANVVVFGAVEGGTFTIDVDEDIPELAVAVVSRAPATVAITGPFAANVVVAYAVGSAASSFSGVASWLAAAAPGSDADGGASPIACEEPADGGVDAGAPCSTPADVSVFFAERLGGTVVFNRCQGAPFDGTLKVSDHGACP